MNVVPLKDELILTKPNSRFLRCRERNGSAKHGDLPSRYVENSVNLQNLVRAIEEHLRNQACRNFSTFGAPQKPACGDRDSFEELLYLVSAKRLLLEFIIRSMEAEGSPNMQIAPRGA